MLVLEQLVQLVLQLSYPREQKPQQWRQMELLVLMQLVLLERLVL